MLIVNAFSLIYMIVLNRIEGGRTYFLLQLVSLVFIDLAWLTSGLINPGIAIVSSNEGGEICEHCHREHAIEVEKIVGRMHCSECHICIDDYEQHFALTGGCIGKNNFLPNKFFMLGLLLWGISMLTATPYVYYS